VKRGFWMALLALAVAALGSAIYYRTAIAPTAQMLEQRGGELEWLRREFQLSDTQFAAVRQVHEEYAPKCEQMCARIAEANAKADRLIRANRTVTPEIETALKEAATLNEECHRAMLGHVYAVAGHMAPEQASRYVERMRERILEPGVTHQVTTSSGQHREH
jgi:hypothetical protein